MTQTILNDVFAQFKLAAKVVGVRKGPSVFRYEVELGRGTSVRDITKIMPDVARICGTENARLISPLSNGLVAIELPREARREILEYKDIIEDIRYDLELSAPLSFVLGAEMALDAEEANEELLRMYGMELNPVTADLAKLPHLLVAGATGSGKSVFINTLICSIVDRMGPDKVQMVLIDPKKVELSIYADLPHLAYPLVTEADEAKKALEFVVDEMDARYLMMSRHGVRNIAEFNSAVAEGKIDEKHIPLWLVVIDELADLMMVAKKDVEKSIVRITQLARAAGIHLVVATQRPSVDVITGLIKANMPSRLAFAVASKTDSRVILDQMGAESLTGMGDAFFVPQGSRDAQRIQCVYIDAEEVDAIISQWESMPDTLLNVDQDHMTRLRFAVENQLYASAPMVERMFGVDTKTAKAMLQKLDMPEVTF
jgi:S-DNA-T family DNA segregation ATPase FtsK/SpoIIIE